MILINKILKQKIEDVDKKYQVLVTESKALIITQKL